MKQKRTFIAILLVIAVLGLGIAYANITDDVLTINGTAKVSPDDSAFKVMFTDESHSGKVSKVELTENGTKATLTMDDFKAAEEAGQAVLTISNLSEEYAADLEVTISGASADSNFEITEKLAASTLTNVNGDASTTTYTLDVKALKAVTSEVTKAITVEITATPVAQ